MQVIGLSIPGVAMLANGLAGAEFNRAGHLVTVGTAVALVAVGTVVKRQPDTVAEPLPEED